MGLTSTYQVETSSTRIMRRTNIDPQGAKYVTVTNPDGSSIETSPDGTVTSITKTPDPRLGMFSPVTGSMTVATPGGLIYSLAETRTVSFPSSSGLTGGSMFGFTTLTDTKTINGNAYTTVYDASTKTFTYTTPMGRQSFTTLNDKGRPILSQVAGLLPVNYGYDAQGHLISVAQGSGTTARLYTIGYDPQNRISSITDPLLRSTGFAYDLAGRITQETLPDGRVINFSYDGNGNITSITPPSKPAHNFDYTPVDLLKDYVMKSRGR